MIIPKKIKDIFSQSDTYHGLGLFTPDEIKKVEASIKKTSGGYNIMCLKRKKYFVAKPEEIVRQLWIQRLMNTHNYPEERICLEVSVTLFSGAAGGAIDVAIYREDLVTPYIYLETKRPDRTDGIRQLKDYCDLHGVPIALWSNGNELVKMHKEDPNIYRGLPRIPNAGEELLDVLKERHTFEWLTENDLLKEGTTSLHKIILDLKESVLANVGDGLFDNIFRLLYSKLFDEDEGKQNAKYQLEFFKGDRTDEQVFDAINNLFEGAKEKWPNIFELTEAIDWEPEVVSECISYLESIRLFDSNLRIIDEAFENLIPQKLIDEGGQFFTPRAVQTMTAKMLDPQPQEYIVDIACGSSGFLLHSVRHVGGNPKDSILPRVAVKYAEEKIYGLDFSKSAVKISKCINVMIGDGKSHIFHVPSSLDPTNWSSEAKLGMKSRLRSYPKDIPTHRLNQQSFRNFNFDILMTNPPFGGAIKKDSVIIQYELGEKDGKALKEVKRHILFINRALEFLRPGGRMAIVLPQGILTNANANHIRRYLIENGRILGVVGLHGNTFKTATSTKTSVVLLQKYTDNERDSIQEIIQKHEEGWITIIDKIKEECKEVSWESDVSKIKVHKDLKSFCEYHFEESDEDEQEDTTEQFEKIKKEIRKYKKNLIIEESKLENKKSEMDKEEDINKKKTLRDEQVIIQKLVTTTKNEIKKKEKEISKYTNGGKIYLTINNKTTTKRFKKYWIDTKIISEIDYSIFFGLNKKPLKDNKGNYIHKKDDNGENILGEDNLPVIDHDLDEIATEFEKFIKKHKIDFRKK